MDESDADNGSEIVSGGEGFDDTHDSDSHMMTFPINGASTSFDTAKSILMHQKFTETFESMAASGSGSGTVDVDAPNKPISVYHLLLDSQLELTSDGNQIKCSMPSGPGSGPQSKKRKRSHPNFNPTTLLASALPTPHQAKHQTHEKARSSVISAQEAALNSGEPERVRRHFLEALHPDCIFQLDLSALGLRHGVHVYREIRGASGIASYFASVVGTIPDSVTLYWQEKSVKLPDGNRELSCNFHMVGRQVFEINVLDDEVSHGEQDKLAEAVAGLTSLFSAAPSSDDTVDSVFEGVVSREDELGNRVDAGAQLFKEESALPSAKRKVRSLNEMNILVAQGSVEFEQGKHLDPPVPMNWTGTVSWIVNPSKQVIRFRSVLD